MGGAGTVPDQAVYTGVNQQWSITNITALEYEISSVSGYVLTSGTMEGEIAGLSSYTGASDQLWGFSPVSGRYSVYNIGTGLRLDSNGGGLGTTLNQWEATNEAMNQLWNLTAMSSISPPLSNGVYSFVNTAGLALDDPGGGGAGTIPDQVQYAGGDQNWTVTLVSSYAYEIASSSGYALTSGTSNGTIAGLSTYTGDESQLWNLVTAGGDTFVINRGSGLLLDDNGGTGTCNQWPWGSQNNQTWNLIAE
jgi:hypothetical protein